jgi:tetratricopeptide (TPR) repeat protein
MRTAGRYGARVRRAALALSMATAIVIGLRVVNDAYYIATRRAERFGLAWNRIALPADAARFAVDAGLGGPVLNHLNFGGYLMWALPVPVFIDGRLEVVGEQFYEAYRAALSSPEGLESLAARYGVRWMIVPYAINARLLGQVSRDARWRLVYFDHLAAIFVRAGDDAAGLPDPIAADPGAAVDIKTLPGLGPTARPGPVRRWLDGLVRRRTFPTDAYNRGLFHLFRNDLPRAAAAFATATAESDGRYYETYNNLGAVLYRQGRAAEARACYRVVLQDRPDHPIARQRAGSVHRRRASRW